MAEPIISYPGAKWSFMKDMIKYFPLDMEVFIEPFLGGGSVSLSVADDPRFSKLKRMIAGDLAPEQWAFWCGVQKDPKKVREIATEWFTKACPSQAIAQSCGVSRTALVDYIGDEAKDFEHDDLLTDDAKANLRDNIKLYNQAVKEAKDFWDWTQKVDTSNMSLEERAARIILVNKISFSGMGDSGSLSKDQFFDFKLNKLDRLEETSKLLQRMEIYNVSFEETMKYAWENPDKTFIFLDPPYYKQESSGLYGRNGDTHHGFPHQKFAEVTKSMPCKWFVTYDDSTYVRRMFAGNTDDGKKIIIEPYKLKRGYTMAGKTAEDALDGEEIFIYNFSEDDDVEFDF